MKTTPVGHGSGVFDHVTIRASDPGASKRFYETVLSTLGIEPTASDEPYDEWDDFSIGDAEDKTRVTRRLHVAFPAPSREHVDRFWQAGVEAGYRDDGTPGPRPQYGDDYYGGFLLDPDGNSAEAVHYSEALREDGVVDHLWIRVADVAEAKRFYEHVAPFGGFRLNHDSPERAQFVGGTGSFSLVAGEPTENVHIAFPASENATVDEFHAALVGTGYRDYGGPGERPVYHPGYYGAFILDPDGNNIEVVCHNR
ncbi:MAG TPA: VOC family protein [Gaiellaceae bacterium]|nr:VOC family protein [Gaiellaceae bacterium]